VSTPSLKVVIVNDTSSSNHFGCKLVMRAIKENLESRNVEILATTSFKEHWSKAKPYLDKADLVIVNGEGSIHHGKRMELLEIAEQYPSVLINAVYEKVPKNHYLKFFKYVSVRESLSRDAMLKHGVDPVIVPDLIFYNNPERPEVTNDLCVVDSVAIGEGLGPKEDTFMSQMGSAYKVCTGRFHAACLAMLWGMPFSAYPSNTYKTEGMMNDAGCLHLYKNNQEEALNSIGEFDASEYIATARDLINKMFDKITGQQSMVCEA